MWGLTHGRESRPGMCTGDILRGTLERSSNGSQDSYTASRRTGHELYIGTMLRLCYHVSVYNALALFSASVTIGFLENQQHEKAVYLVQNLTTVLACSANPA